MRRAYIIWRSFQDRFLQYVAALLLLGPTLLALLEVVRRYVFGQSFSWQQDAVTYGILSGVFLFFAITQSRDLHLRVSLVPSLLAQGGETGRLVARLLAIFSAILGLVFCAYLVWRGIPVAERMVERNRMTESLVLPLWPFFITFLAGMGMMAVSFLFQAYAGVLVLLGRESEWPQIASEGDGEPIL
ncbi:MAG: TRAP transporter small permease [Alphaproteobacteria bacterium]